MLLTLASLPNPPKSVPINMLVKTNNSPLGEVENIDYFEFIRTIAVARILMPTSSVRLSAGRSEMNEQMQSLCFLSGANSIFYGEKLLTTENPEMEEDRELFKKLGIEAV
jgi:biotin synthase